MKTSSGFITLFMGIVTFLTSCSTLHRQPLSGLSDNYCEPAIQYRYDSSYLPKPTNQALRQVDTSLTLKYSQHDLLLANAVGILPLLGELNKLQNNGSPEAHVESIKKRQHILNRLLLASTQIDGFAAELDCEGERADQIATYLDQLDAQRTRRLTILSVVIGAATTVATALIQSSSTNKVVGIGGGVIGTGFGGLAAFSSNRSVLFSHPRNLLTDIWKQPEQSSVYPPMIWYILNERRFSNKGHHSISYNIRQRWHDYVINGASSAQLTLYFGDSGLYEAGDLHNRANMLNELQSSVRSINQDLQSLVLAVSQ
ncbi:hypothetical protein [Spirosoma sp. KNUC1025]|uniref:hypothetical protein n=1 Tax=Spirosoma sp. KNUC1025 TaxID=2894082 RepID=UPI0038701A26|nr:hypothetical protein LN737_21760 [Spirosoma sp. KNUC1025]